jgi:hypothetical protein
MSPEPSQNVNDAATSNIVGQLLVEAGMIDADGLVQAREVQDRFKLTIGKAIAHLGLADEEGISAAIARHLNIDYLGADVPEIASATTELLSAEFCRKRQVVPLGMQGSSLRVAIADPFAYHTIQDVELITGHRTITVAASPNIGATSFESVLPSGKNNAIQYLRVVTDGRCSIRPA